MLPAAETFVAALRNVYKEGVPEAEHWERCRELLRSLIADRAVREHARSWPVTGYDPQTDRVQNLLFYEDPDYGFVINGVVREPNRTGGAHDHADAWVLYGLLDGTEILERFERIDDRSRDGYAEIRLTSATQGGPGKADLVPPYDIHAEQGGPGRSVAVILRSNVLVGRVLQGRYDRETGAYSTGPGPEQIPYDLTV